MKKGVCLVYYTYVLILRREWGEIRHYFTSREKAEKYAESAAFAGCGTGTIHGCYRSANLPDYERVHW